MIPPMADHYTSNTVFFPQIRAHILSIKKECPCSKMCFILSNVQTSFPFWKWCVMVSTCYMGFEIHEVSIFIIFGVEGAFLCIILLFWVFLQNGYLLREVDSCVFSSNLLLSFIGQSECICFKIGGEGVGLLIHAPHSIHPWEWDL